MHPAPLRLLSVPLLLLACAPAPDTAQPVVPPTAPPASAPAQPAGPPQTRVDVVVDTIHGVQIEDPYRWLEDQSSPETRAFIDSQNDYTETLLGSIGGRERLEARLGSLMSSDWMGTPTIRGGQYFYMARGGEQPLSRILVRDGAAGEERVLVDPGQIDPSHTAAVGLFDVNKDGTRIAYTIRRNGEDEVEVKIRDVATGKDIDDALPRGLYGAFAFRPDGRGFYYTKRIRTEGGRIHEHIFGTDIQDDPVLFGEGYGHDAWIDVQTGDGGRYLLISVQHGWARGELHLYDTRRKRLTTVAKDVDARFEASFARTKIVAMTNLDAPNNRIVLIDPRRPTPRHWKTVVPEGKDVIKSFSLGAGRIYVNRLVDVSTRIEAVSASGTSLGELPIPPMHSAWVSGSWDEDTIFVGRESFVVPPTVNRIEVSTGDRSLWHRRDVDVNSEGFSTEQVWYASKDGTKVPMYVVRAPDTQPDGNLATFLTGYGGFNVSLVPRFNPTAVLVAELGGVWARPNIRGGGEFGETWHRAGMLENKQNVFDDFIAAAEHLIASGYTNPSRLGIRGVSNGGLLMGSVTTQRPDLFRAVLCEYPDLDMVRYYTFKDSNNPPALLEYGNAEDPEQFKYLHAYSPYQKVTPGTNYPAVLFTSGDGDTRVPPLQARKMTARMQAATTSGHPVALLYDVATGHAGGRTQAQAVAYRAKLLAFMMDQLGVELGD